MMAGAKPISIHHWNNYHENSKDNNYYNREKGEVIVLGEGAKYYGLENELSFEKLSQITKNRKVFGIDIPINLPKSFSLERYFGVSKLGDIIEKEYAGSIKDCCAYIEKSGLVTYKAKVNGETIQGHANNIVMLAYPHDFNRSKEPQLHFHVVIPNSGEDIEGNNRALNYLQLMKARKDLGRYVLINFAKRMQKHGVPIRIKMVVSKKGKIEYYPELAYVSDNQIEAFSTPRKKILEKENEYALEGKYNGLSQGEKRQIAAYEVRNVKNADFTQEDLERLKIRANDVGLKLYDNQKEIVVKDFSFSHNLFDVYETAKQNLMTKEGVFTEHQLLCEAWKEGLKNGVFINENDIKEFWTNDVELISDKDSNDKPFHKLIASRQFFEAERDVLRLMNLGKNAFNPLVEDAEQALKSYNENLIKDKGWGLDEEQLKAAKEVLESRDFTLLIQGEAGAGKTTTIDAIHAVLKSNGLKPYGIAPAASAATVLEGTSGIESFTVHKFNSNIRKWEKDLTSKSSRVRFRAQEELKALQGNPLFLDEASMSDTVTLAEAMRNAYKYKMPFRAIGDRDQLPAVGSGFAFAQLQDAGASTVELTRIYRQKDEQLLEIAKKVTVEKNVDFFFDAIRAQLEKEDSGKASVDDSLRVYQSMKLRDLIRQASKNYKQSILEDKNTVIVGLTNETVSGLNDEIRYYLRQEGRLDSKEYSVKVEDREETLIDRRISVGDRIVFLKNDDKNDVYNGKFGKIENIETDKEGQVKNVLVKVEKVRGGDNDYVNFNPQEFKRWDLGYAITVHKSQGISVDEQHLVMTKSRLNSYQLTNVMATRAKEKLNIYISDVDTINKQSRQWIKKKSAFETFGKESDAKIVERKQDKVVAAKHHEQNPILEKCSKQAIKEEADKTFKKYDQLLTKIDTQLAAAAKYDMMPTSVNSFLVKRIKELTEQQRTKSNMQKDLFDYALTNISRNMEKKVSVLFDKLEAKIRKKLNLPPAQPDYYKIFKKLGGTDREIKKFIKAQKAKSIDSKDMNAKLIRDKDKVHAVMDNNKRFKSYEKKAIQSKDDVLLEEASKKWAKSIVQNVRTKVAGHITSEALQQIEPRLLKVMSLYRKAQMVYAVAQGLGYKPNREHTYSSVREKYERTHQAQPLVTKENIIKAKQAVVSVVKSNADKISQAASPLKELASKLKNSASISNVPVQNKNKNQTQENLLKASLKAAPVVGKVVQTITVIKEVRKIISGNTETNEQSHKISRSI